MVDLDALLANARATLLRSGEGDAPDNQRTEALVEAAWPDLSASESWQAAELCRLAMVSLARAGHHDVANVWRQRCVRLSFQSSWPSGLARVIVSEMFRTYALRPPGPGLPGLPGAPSAAAKVLDELLPLLPAISDAAEREELLGLYYEKRGFLAFAAKDFAEGLRVYDDALEHAHAMLALEREHREAKIRAGRALCAYCIDPGGRSGRAAIAETQEVMHLANARGWRQIAETASHNLAMMAADRQDMLRPYETM